MKNLWTPAIPLAPVRGLLNKFELTGRKYWWPLYMNSRNNFSLCLTSFTKLYLIYLSLDFTISWEETTPSLACYTSSRMGFLLCRFWKNQYELLNENLSARHRITPLKLLLREDPETLRATLVLPFLVTCYRQMVRPYC